MVLYSKMAGEVVLPKKQDLELWCFWLFPVILLLLWDIRQAWKGRAFWIPGSAPALSSVIILVLSYIDYSHVNFASPEKEVRVVLRKNELVIESGRLMMCVLIAYLLPGMARSSSVIDGINLTVLAVSIANNIGVELQSIEIRKLVNNPNESPSPSPSLSTDFRVSHRRWSIVYDAFLFSGIEVLLALMIITVLLGRRIQKMISQKIPLALSCCCNPAEMQRYENIEDHVLKCWIVVRASRPNYVIARTIFSSIAAAIVTYCVVLSVIKWRYFQLADYENEGKLVQLVIVGQLAIVFIGWISVIIRWLVSRLYYSSSGIDMGYIAALALDDLRSDIYEFFKGLMVKDKRILEKRIRDRQRLQEERIQYQLSGSGEPLTRALKKMLWCLWSVLWRPLEIILLYPFKISSAETDQFSKYREALDIILWQGENADQICISNKRAFDKVNHQLIKGHVKGKADSVELITLLKHKTEAANHFELSGKTCWKNRAVLLIRFMMYCSDGHSDVVESALKAYNQAWEYMDFCESLETNLKLLGREADSQFDDLEKVWEEVKSAKYPRDKVEKLLEEKIMKPHREEMERLSMKEREASTERERKLLLDNIQERKHWVNEAEKIIKGANPMADLERLLADVLYHCMQELKRAIIEMCNKWAEEGREQHIFDSAFMTAKAKGVLDEILTVGSDSTPQNSSCCVDIDS